MTIQTEAPYIDIYAPDFDLNSPVLAETAARSPYATGPGGILVFPYADADAFTRDHRFTVGSKHYLRRLGITSGPLYSWFMGSLMSQSGETHRRLRNLAGVHLSTARVRELQPLIREQAELLAGQLETPGDFIAQFAGPFPSLVMCRILGIPPEGFEEFHTAAGDIGLAFALNITTDRGQIEASITRLADYVTRLIGRCRATPVPGMVSDLIRARDVGELSDDELHYLLMLIVWAGQDTTKCQLSRTVATFAAYPAQWDLLAARPELAGQAVDETIRFAPQTRVAFHFALEDVTYKFAGDHGQGVPIPEGDWALVCTELANRDPRAFANPNVLDITIPRRRRHLAYGGGLHHCLGYELANAEMAEALRTLTKRYRAPVLTGKGTWRPTLAMIYGADALPTAFQRR